ncbi:uncharacterized protein DSM5745_09223 [Aspergillus mulundensis]|uniref:C3H1-type domain-containing protein n=1 Tax=Aspergillus mulundensis TaxID=1810919 RepID=A0A3D8R002_9EURO|nr:Uncharacterized protein DSM5745_09223 [Aspergillus mulundensis]RDW67357.1 Uncharacterized protein DSM5745_09223 [Aspergillus mulundensis]
MDPVNPASLPPEYWSSLDPYVNPDSSQQQQHHHSHPPQQQSTPQQTQHQPLGIGWDHPVLHSQTSHRDSTHGLYQSATPQGWQQNSLHHQTLAPPTPQDLGISAQYRQVPQYAQGQVTFDSRAVPAPENPHYQSYSFTPNFYTPQHISLPDPFPQTHSPQPAQQPSRPASYQPQQLHQNSLPQYAIPPGFPDDSTHTSLSFSNDFAQPPPRVPEQTINPQFINSPQPASQDPPLNNTQNQFVYVNPAEDPNTNRMFSYFPDNVQLQSILPHTGVNSPLAPGQFLRTGGAPINGLKSVPAIAPAKPVLLRANQTGVKKQALPKKVSVKKANGKGSVSSGSDSYESDSDLEIQEPEEPSPLPFSRPAEPEAAANYDALRAVWFPRNRRPKVDKVKTALVSFKDVVKNYRDSWKETAQALKAAENKGESNDTILLRKKVALQRRLMSVVVSATLDRGHPLIVEKLGEHPMAVSAIYSFLLDRHQASDIDGSFTLNILKLLARFITMDEEVLQKTNVAKLLPRFVKKGSPEVKALAQTILDNAAASTKRKQENSKPGSKEGSPAKPPVSGATTVDGARRDVSGSKRPRDGEANGQPAPRKVVVTSNIKPGAKPSGLATNGSVKRTPEAGSENKPTGTAASTVSRPKANIVAPKPTNLFGSLTSASKKPGTSNAERAAAAAAAKTSTEKKEAPRPAFSLGDIMADLDKQKAPPPKESSESRTPETEEERTKRLRKEARRKLRVTWKPDDSLTDIRYFTHDPDEELGPGDRSRQRGDVKGEGSILKLHKNLDELEEDDDGGMREEQFFNYYVPSGKDPCTSRRVIHSLTGTEIDDSEISAETRAANHIKRGGTQQPTSPEAKVQEHREATTLMVFHTSPADVPPSAKEPPAPDSSEAEPEVLPFGELPDFIKDRQQKYYAMIRPQPAPQSQPNSIFDLLKSIQNPGQQQSTPPPQAPQPAQAPAFNLEQTINMLSQQPQVPQAPQIPQQPVIDQRLLSMFYGQQPQQTQPQPQPQPQIHQAQPGAIAPNLLAILSQFSNQNQNQNQQTPPVSEAPQTSGHYENPERKRMREAGGFDDDDKWRRNRMNAPNKKHPKAGSVPCRYWAEGRCLKGQDCTFRHDPLSP